MSGKGIFIYHPSLEAYRFKPEHPFNPARLQTTVSLLKALQLIRDEEMVPPRKASLDELLLGHDADYISMVQDLSEGKRPPVDGYPFGLGTEDNPIFSGMHEAAGLVVGATLSAGETVMEGRASHAVSISGGMHHAGRRQASGFCIYNDVSVAVRYLYRKYHIRTVYIDTDAHHGDGVQWEFYEDPNVLTISFHETGRFIFPGSGGLTERGKKEGFGYCVNVPLEPFTDDDSFLQCFKEVVPTLVEVFQPDLIISQNGCDAHFFDSLTHISLTMRAFQEIPRIVHELAHEFCGGRWIAVGGGGYDPFRVCARAWAWLWAEVSQHPVPEKIPASWLREWSAVSPWPLPNTTFDHRESLIPIPRKEEIAEKNFITARKALEDAMAVFSKFF